MLGRIVLFCRMSKYKGKERGEVCAEPRGLQGFLLSAGAWTPGAPTRGSPWRVEKTGPYHRDKGKHEGWEMERLREVQLFCPLFLGKWTRWVGIRVTGV